MIVCGVLALLNLLEKRDAINHWKSDGIDLTPVLTAAVKPHQKVEVRCTQKQDHGLENALDNKLIELAADAIHHGKKINQELPILNINRTVGTMLSHEVVKTWGARALPIDTIHFKFNGLISLKIIVLYE